MTSTPTSALPAPAGPGDPAPAGPAPGDPARAVPRPAAPAPAVPGSAPGAFLFASGAGTLRASGVRARVPESPGRAVGADAAALLAAERAAGNPDPLLVGCLGFLPGRARLVVPRVAVRVAGPVPTADEVAPPPPLTAPPSAPATVGTRWDARAEPTPPGYAAAVARALEMIAAGRVEKVVLARSSALTAPEPLDVPAVLARLGARNPGAYAFAADVGDPAAAPDAAPATLIGASPELLVSRRGATVVSNPLAGTAPRSPDPEEDARRGEALAASAKDLREHALVVERVAEGLAPFCTRLHVPAGPSLTRTPALWHLSTRIEGTLRDPAPTSLELAEALHPTPAVCGAPTGAAREVIAELEEFPRDWYSGLVGWCDADGDGEWAIAIRCAEIAGRTARLYAGAGVVEGSRPEAELAETAAKFRTLLAALGLESTP